MYFLLYLFHTNQPLLLLQYRNAAVLGLEKFI